MINALKKDIAATLYVGPVLASDGTAYTAATIADFALVKNGTRGAFNAVPPAAVATHDTTGHYTITAQATDTDTLGRLTVILNKATYVMPPTRYQVVPASIFTALVDGTTYLLVDLKAILGTLLTETVPGYLAVAYKKLFDVATPVLTAAAAMRGTDGAATPGAQMDLVNAPNGTAVTAIQAGLATSANQTTILDRLGAWAGSGRNSILGAFQSLFRSDADATVPSDINANLGSGAGDANNTTDSAEAQRDNVGTAGANLTTLGDTRLANLDAAVTTRLAPTTASRTLDVSDTGEAGLDFSNVKDAASAHTLTNLTVPTVTDVTNGVKVSVGTGAGQINASGGKVPATLAAGDVTGNLPADVKLWLAAAPAALTTSGYVQAAVLRWLTDNAAGTPGALASGSVRAVDASGNPVAPATATTAIAAFFAGMTSLANWLRAGLRKDAPDATALSEINSGGGTYSALSDALEAIRDRGDAAWLGSLGSGANPVTITLVDTLAAPVPGLTVVAWNNAITARLGYGTTNASGQVVLNLDAGDIKIAVSTTPAWVAVAATSYTVTNTGAQAVPNIVLTAQSVTPPPSADTMPCILDVYDDDYALAAGIAITFQLISGGSAGQSHYDTDITGTSNSYGRVQVNLLKSGNYRARRGASGKWVTFTVSATGTSYTLPKVLGHP